MSINIKPVFEESIDMLTEMRMLFINEFEPGFGMSENAAAEKANRVYLDEHFKNKSYIGYLGSLDGEIVCAAGMLLYKLPPILSRTDRLQGHLLSVYTKPQFRSRGFGSEMMRFIIEDARQRGIFRIYLNATPAGETLYRKFGFHEEKDLSLTRLTELPLP